MRRARALLTGVSVCLALTVVTDAAQATGAPQAGDQGSAVAKDAFSDEVVAAHNAARARHGAPPVSWDPSMTAATQQYANACRFKHSNSQGKYGENLYASSDPKAGIKEAVDSWMAEASKYNYNRPGFSAATGHFTQLVWKSTTKVSAVVVQCGAGTIMQQASRFVVVRYTPAGNYPGQFPQNVGRPVK